jgi:hypothetical protein
MKYKNILGYENYIIYEDGKIFNNKTGKFLKNVMGERYEIVLLYKNGIRKMHYVHRLVAQAFCIKNKDCNQVNHKDLNRLNNNYTNLEWVTSKENVNHYRKSEKFKPAVYTKRWREKIALSKMKKIKCLETNKIFNCMTDFAAYKQISLSQVSQKLNNVYANNLNAIFI